MQNDMIERERENIIISIYVKEKSEPEKQVNLE